MSRIKDGRDIAENSDDLDNDWLASVPEEEQIEEMRAWFRARYEDPANETPYDSDDGQYFFAWGGPYDPADILPERFDSIVPESVITKLVSELHIQVGHEWAPIDHEGVDYEDAFSLDVTNRDDPMRVLRMRLEEIQGTFALVGNWQSQQLLNQLAHGAAISALEAYLWDTISFWLSKEPEVLKDLVGTNKDLASRRLELGDIFLRFEQLEQEARIYFENFVWHRLDKVKEIFEPGLKVTFPEISQLMKEVLKRHDIVHRGGRTKQGRQVVITQKDAQNTLSMVAHFASAFEDELRKRFQPEYDLPF